MKIDSEGTNRLDCEPAIGRSVSERTTPHTLRRTGALLVVTVMVAVGFSGLVQALGEPVLDLSDNIVFYDDFEDSGTGGSLKILQTSSDLSTALLPKGSSK